MALKAPERIKARLLDEVVELYSKGEISAGRAAEMLGIARAEFYDLLGRRKAALPEKLDRSLLRELRELERPVKQP